MKEATGEANLTILVVVLIAVVLIAAQPIITGLMDKTKERSECSVNGGEWKNGSCSYGS